MNINNFLDIYKKIIARTYRASDVIFSKSKIYVYGKNAYNDYMSKLRLYETYVNRNYIYSFKSK